MATKLLYQGHGSYRITAADGRVIYIDPYAGEGYDKSADILLVTHQHDDHNKTALVTQKPACKVITNVEALAGGKHNTFEVGGIVIEAVEASNANHDPAQCVGLILTVDGIKIYIAADTSKTKSMESFAARKLDYALLPIDGYYNMDAKDAAECARLIGARVNIPVHMKPGELFDRERAEAFDAPGRRIVAAGEEIEL
jgi:L-ascorbate metabolism protein UlaG (beta-lactamase superfamily)